MCVCVCVCERERERGGSVFVLKSVQIFSYFLVYSGAQYGITSDGFFELEDLPK